VAERWLQRYSKNRPLPGRLKESLLDLHHALDELSVLDSRAARVIELRYFGGLTEKEAAEVLGISIATLKRDWEAGRAWLVDRLGWGQRSTLDK